MPLSAVIITKNAASQLGKCLESVAFADEMLVVDSGSTDGTVELARNLGARVIDKEWLGFGAQKQFAVNEAHHDWVLCVDADERVSEALRASIIAELAAPQAVVYELARSNYFLGRWLRHGEGYPDWCLRLFDRHRARWSDDPVHEKVVTDRDIVRLEGELRHDSAESMEKYIEKQNHYTTIQAEIMFAEGKRGGILLMLVSPLVRFVKFYVLRLGFLDGAAGFVHIVIGCMNSFHKYAKLIALQRSAE